MLKQSHILSIVLILSVSLFFTQSCKIKEGIVKKVKVEEVKVEFVTNTGIKPFFSWKTAKENYIQKAWQIEVYADRPMYDTVWNSGKQENSASFQIEYAGAELIPGNRYFVRVKTWDSNDKQSEWSDPVMFVEPIRYPDNWKARWITFDYKKEAPLPVFRKEFKINSDSAIDYVRLYISAPGYYEAYLNGKKIGKNVLDPAQTNYEDYTYYTAYNIDDKELSEHNVLGVMLGNGWYNQNVMNWEAGISKGMVYGQPVFIAQLVIHYDDGTVRTIGTDAGWKWTKGPITYSSIYGGEHFDARLVPENWNKPGKISSEWKEALLAKVHPTKLYEQFAEPVRVMKELPAKTITDKGNGVYIVDFGQNIGGWVKIQVKGNRGDEISLRCTERLDDDGNINARSTGHRVTKVYQSEKYICKGEGTKEVWHPRFTHFGFRYAEVRGLNEVPEKEDFTAQVIYSSVSDAGSFKCSEDNINQLHKLAKWTFMSNMPGVPIDCPHREKGGWTGDVHTVAKSLIYNFDVQRFLKKYLFDMRSSGRESKKQINFGKGFKDRSVVIKPAGITTMIAPGRRTSGTATPDWGTAIVQIPWYLYEFYGDKKTLEEFYPDMKRWVEYVHNMSEDGIIRYGLGDWCPPGGWKYIDCPVALSSTAFHILDVKIMLKASEILGKHDDIAYYSKMLKQLTADFNRHFFDKEHLTYGSQTANTMALDIDIAPKEYRKQVAGAIVRDIKESDSGFINVGIFGLPRIFKALAENGYEDEVYRLLTKKGENSFAFMWEHYDATTLWEILPLGLGDKYPVNTSNNHMMQGGFDAWFYSGIAGINPSVPEPGFKLIIFKPYLTKYLKSASAKYEAMTGTIVSNWESEKGIFKWHLIIPPNSKGTVYVPTYGRRTVKLNGKKQNIKEEKDGFSLLGKLGPGIYEIVAI